MSVNLELDNSCPSTRKTGYIHVLNKPGRPLRNVSYFEISTVLSVFTKYPCNALIEISKGCFSSGPSSSDE